LLSFQGKEGWIVYSFNFVQRDCADVVWVDRMRHRANTDARADATAGSDNCRHYRDPATGYRDAVAAANLGYSNPGCYADGCRRARVADARRGRQHTAPRRDAHANATRCRANRNFAPDQVRRAKIIESQL
jgi:hypothetical protein